MHQEDCGSTGLIFFHPESRITTQNVHPLRVHTERKLVSSLLKHSLFRGKATQLKQGRARQRPRRNAKCATVHFKGRGEKKKKKWRRKWAFHQCKWRYDGAKGSCVGSRVNLDSPGVVEMESLPQRLSRRARETRLFRGCKGR